MKQKKRILFFLFFTCIALDFVKAQTEIDSLMRLLRSSNEVNRQMELYAFIGESYYLNSTDSALKYTNMGIEVGDKVQENKRDSTFYNYLSSLLNNAAFINQKQGNYYQAILLYQRSIDAFSKLSRAQEGVTAKLNLGTLYYDIGEYDLAFNYLENVKKNLKQGDGVALANCQLTLGSIYILRGNIESGLNNYYSAMALFKKSNHFSGEGRAFNKIGEVYLKNRDYTQALENFRNALANFSGVDDLRGMSESKYFIATIKLLEHEKDSAKYYANQSLKEAIQINYPKNIRDVSLLLYSIYSEENDFKRALEMHLLFTKTDSLLAAQDAIKITAKEQLESDFDKKTLLIKNEQAKKDAVNQESLKRQKLISIVSVGGGILLLLLLALSIRTYRTKQKANVEISIQKAVVETKNKEILDSINYANRIQQTLLAHDHFLKSHLENYFILFQPKDIVSGDFYWATSTNESFYLAICDSTGHGVPGAFMSLLNISFLNEAINEKNISEPGKIFDHARRRLIEGVSKDGAQDGMDGILFKFKFETKQFQYASAHNAPIIIRNRTILHLENNKMPVGKSPKENTLFSTFTTQLQTGDLIFGFTDGMADQFGGPKGKKLKNKAIEEILISNCEKPLTEIKSELERAFVEWKSDLEQVDDVLVFCYLLP